MSLTSRVRRIFTLAGVAAIAAGIAAGPARAQTTATGTIGDGDAIGSSLACPGGAAVVVDAFTLSASVDTNAAKITVQLLPTNAYTVVERVEILSNGGAVLGAAIPIADKVEISFGTPLPIGTTPVQYKVSVKPKTHAAMPPGSAGVEFGVRARATLVSRALGAAAVRWTASDTTSGTAQIDNSAPSEVLWRDVSVGATNVLMSWAGTPEVLVLQRLGGPIVGAPKDGVAPTSGALDETIRFSGVATGFDATGLTTARPYYFSVFVKDSCGNWSSGSSVGPVVPGGVADGDATPNGTKPVVGLLNPSPGPVTAPFRVQVRVFSPKTAGGADQPITNVTLTTDDGSATSSVALARNPAYGAPADGSGVYELQPLDVGLTLAPGRYTLRAHATNASGTVYSGGIGVIVGGKGDGNLLVRDNSSQLCNDCHAIPTHSAESTSTKHGSWWVSCRACHQPHGTTNAALVANEITPPSVAGVYPPARVYYGGGKAYSPTGGASNPGAASYANADGSGPCQVCHTRTAYFTRDALNTDHNAGSNCASCHQHAKGLAASCAGCHGTPSRVAVAGADAMVAAAPPAAASTNTNAVGAHQAHVNQATLRAAPLACTSCHTIPNAHDGAADALSFNGLASTGGTPIWNPGASTCSATYCHGAALSGGSNLTPSWTLGQTMTCGSCHGSPPPLPHVSRTDCGTCHGAGYSGTTVAKTSHINGTVETVGTCATCHFQSSGEVNDWQYGNGTMATINEGEWAGRGHGQSSVLGSSGANPCSYCHDSSVAHDVATNPFRLRGTSGAGGVTAAYGTATPAERNAPCLNCHGAADSGVDPDGSGTEYGLENSATTVSSTHAGGLHGGNNDGGARCWDCHDGHGDGSNIKMVSADVIRDSNDAYGLSATRSATPVVFTANVTGTDYAKSAAPFNGVCNVCHAGTGHYTATSGDGHNSGAKCVNCHAHDQGATDAFGSAGGTCNACHNAPPNVGKHLAHDQVAPVPTSYGDLTAHGTATQYGFGCGKCHGTSLTNHLNDVGGTAADPYRVNMVLDGGGTYTAGGTVTNDVGPGGQVFGWTNGSGCSANYCHDPQGATYSSANVSWNQAGAVTCSSCHDDDVSTTLSGAHPRHVNASGYDFACNRCHSTTSSDGTTITDKRLHANAAKDVAFDGSNPAGAWASASCSSLYCHSNGQPLGAGAPTYAAAIGWTGSVNATCTSCHGGDSTSGANLATNKHPQHVNQASVLGTNYGCVDCHSATATGNRALASPPTQHVDGGKDVAFATRAGGQTSGAYASPTCTSTYCHSSGQATPSYRSVAWDQAGTVGCNGCHGLGNASGAPDYANGGAGSITANSHAAHTANGADSSTCARCHSTTVNALGTAILAGTAHTDGVRQIAISGTFDTNGATANYDPATKTCNSVSCHGPGSPQWGAPLSCAGCHQGTSDAPNYAYNDGTVAAIGGSEFTSVGHGQTTAAYSEFTGTTDRCVYCHDDQNASADHGQTGNPFRLRGAAAAGGATAGYSTATVAATNAVCTNCHAVSGANGVDPDGVGGQGLVGPATLRIDAYHAGAKHAGTADGGQRCWDCHDPHGDGTNIKMIASNVVADSSDSHGYAATRPATAVVFTANSTGTDFARSAAPFNGVCNVCHAATGGAAHYDRDSGDGHNSGQRCTDCHSHQQPPSGAFWAGEPDTASVSCGGCHSTIWANASGATSKHGLTTTTGTDDTTDWSAASPATLGAYTNRSCVNMCHSNHPHDVNGGTATSATHEGNLYANPSTATTRADNAATRITTGTGVNRAKTDFDPSANTGMCTKCHVKPISAGRPTITDAVYGASSHDFTATSSPAVTWRYTMHDGGVFARNCTKCHASRTEGNTPSSADASGAVHGTSDPSLLAGTRNPGATPAAFVCFNCHGNGTVGTLRSASNVYTEVTKANNHASASDAVHDSAAEASATFNDGRFSGANRHANCMDCHDTHAARSAIRTYPTSGTMNNTRSQIVANGTLVGARGVTYSPPAAVTAGTITINTSGAVTGSGTSFNASMVGSALYANDTWYVITAYTSATALTVYPLVSQASGTAYRIVPNSSASSFGTSPTALANGAGEYQLCFKCHSAFAFGNAMPSPGGSTYTTGTAAFTAGSTTVTGSSTTWTTNHVGWVIKNNANGAWYRVTAYVGATSLRIDRPAAVSVSGAYTLQAASLDLAAEFSPQNASGHPVVTGLANYTGSATPRALQTAQMKAPWNGTGNSTSNSGVGYQTMACTDCHAGDDTTSPVVQGPHGSGVNFMLRGPNTLWPATSNLSQTVYESTFCANCHTWYATQGGHGEHTGRTSTQCYACHIVVPHGGKLGRLIADRDSPNMPSRYAYQGNKTNVQVTGFTKKAPANYGTADCGAQCSSSRHVLTYGQDW